MNLIDALRHAEQQGKNRVHRGAEKLHQVEAAIRRKVQGRAEPEQERDASSSSKGRTGIVSVNGRDIGEMRCTGGRQQS